MGPFRAANTPHPQGPGSLTDTFQLGDDGALTSCLGLGVVVTITLCTLGSVSVEWTPLSLVVCAHVLSTVSLTQPLGGSWPHPGGRGSGGTECGYDGDDLR